MVVVQHLLDSFSQFPTSRYCCHVLVDKSLHKAELSGFTQQTPRLYVGATPKSHVHFCAGTKPTKQFEFSILNSVINNITNCKVEGVEGETFRKSRLRSSCRREISFSLFLRISLVFVMKNNTKPSLLTDILLVFKSIN